MSHIDQVLFTPRAPLWAYCVASGFIALAAAVGFSELATFGFASLGVNVDNLPSRDLQFSSFPVAAAIFLTPVLETLLLAVFISCLLRIGASYSLTVVCAAVGAGALHGSYPITFVATSTAFFVFSSCYVTWRTTSTGSALLAAGVPHLVYNGVISMLAQNGA